MRSRWLVALLLTVLFACGEERRVGGGPVGAELEPAAESVGAELDAASASVGVEVDQGAASPSGEHEARSAPAVRIVSLNPSITNIVVALGAVETLVGVDDWSARVQPAVAEVPRVGGLFNPSLEGILALRPDVVALVPSAQQRDLRDRLTALEIDVQVLENLTLDQVLDSIRRLGVTVGRAAEAGRRIGAIRDAMRATQQRSTGRARPRTVLVLQRDPLYIVGRGSFLDEMLAAAGAENLGAEFDEEYPRAGTEWLIGAAPELILDAAGYEASARAHWSQWPSLPAVAADHIVSVPAVHLTMPGPDLDRSLALLVAWVDGARSAAAPSEPAP